MESGANEISTLHSPLSTLRKKESLSQGSLFLLQCFEGIELLSAGVDGGFASYYADAGVL